jgi:capsular exopolysaccharide synthesis family protein
MSVVTSALPASLRSPAVAARTVLRRSPWVLAICVVAVAAALWFDSRVVPQYQSEAWVQLDTAAAAEALNATGLDRFVPNLLTEVSNARSDQIVDAVVAELGTVPNVVVEAEPETNTLVFRATARSPQQAADAANTWATVYTQFQEASARAVLEGALARLNDRLAALREERARLRQPLQELEQLVLLLAAEEARVLEEAAVDGTATRPPRLDALSAQRAQVQVQRDQLAAQLAPDLGFIDAQISQVASGVAQLELRKDLATLGTAHITQPAVENPAPINDTTTRSVVTALLLGLVVGAGVVFGLEATDRRLRSPGEAAAAAGAPLLATIPRARRRRTGADLGRAVLAPELSTIADSYRRARSALQFATVGHANRSILVTSAGSGEGKSTTAANLAWSFAETTPYVVLVDADFAHARQHTINGVPRSPGLADYLSGTHELVAVAHHLHEGATPIVVIPAGTPLPNSSQVMAEGKLCQSMDLIYQGSDVTIVDSPPVLVLADALDLAKTVDAVVLTARAGETTRDELAEAAGQLRRVGAHLVGVILIGASPRDTIGYAAGSHYRPAPQPAAISTNGPTGPQLSADPVAR